MLEIRDKVEELTYWKLRMDSTKKTGDGEQ